MFLIWGNTLGYFSCMNGGGGSDGLSQSGLEKGYPCPSHTVAWKRDIHLSMCFLWIHKLLWAGLTVLKITLCDLTLTNSNRFLSLYCGKKPILTRCWIFYCWPLLPLLLLTKRILFIHNSLPRGTLPLCLSIKPKCFCSGPCPPVNGRKEEINTFPPWGLPF